MYSTIRRVISESFVSSFMESKRKLASYLSPRFSPGRCNLNFRTDRFDYGVRPYLSET